MGFFKSERARTREKGSRKILSDRWAGILFPWACKS